MVKSFSLVTIMLLLLFGCSGGGVTGPVAITTKQGSRILGLDVKEIPSVTYAIAYDQAMSIGAREVSVPLDWSLLEPSVGSYDNRLADIIEAYYPRMFGVSVKIGLMTG